MRRIPISYKLISAAVILVTGLTATFALISRDLLRDIHQERADKLKRERIADLEERSAAMATSISATSLEALAGLETWRLWRVLRTISDRDARIAYAAIADDQQRVIARSDMDPNSTLESELKLSKVDPNQMLQVEVGGPEGKIREITYPIRRDVGVGLLGYLRIGWSLKNLNEDLKAIASERSEDLENATTVMLTASLGAILMGVLAGIFGGMGLARPIRDLAETARSLSDGDFGARSSVTTRDEIGELAATMNSMAHRIGELVDETRAKAELEQELSVARHIQQALLPDSDNIQRPGLELCGLVESASHCGGDWWAFCELTRSRTLVLVGDVTGHGISSAMLTATARSCLDTVRTLTNNDFRPGYFLRILDQLLRESIGDEFHMTCFASIIDPIESTLTYANAGHNPPFLVRYNGETWRHGWLAARGNRLGDADGYAFVEHTIATSSQDLLCWYTDGLVEARRSDDTEFGTRRLRRVLARHPQSPPNEMLGHVMDDFNRFRDEEPLDDDVTCVIGRIV